MARVKIGRDYRVVLPKELRESQRLCPGQELEIMEFNGQIYIIPLQDIRNLRGILAGVDTHVER